MAAPTEHKTVQARILKYAQEIGWKFVSRGDAEERRRFDPDGATPEDRARTASLYFGDLLHAQVRAFNPKYKEAEGALVGEFARLNADIAGNRDFLTYLRDHTLLQAIAGEFRGSADHYRRGAGRTVEGDREERATEEGTGR